MPASGGEPKRVAQDLPPAGFPIWSADSKKLLVFAYQSALDADWWIASIEGGPARKTGAYDALRSQGFSIQFASGLPRASVWADDTLTFTARKGDGRNIWKTRFRAALASTSAKELHPVITRDGSMVAYTVDDTKSPGLYVVPAAGGGPKQADSQSGPIFDWTPNQNGLLFHPNPRSPDRDLRWLNLQSGVISTFLAKSGASLYQSKFSPDGEWLAFEAVSNVDSRLFVVKVRNGSPLPEKDWILVSDEHGWSDKPRWSPNGNILYFISDRDGPRCIWAQRLHPATKQPKGPPFPIYHFHKSRLSPKNVGLWFLEIDVARDKIVINLGELTGNIWSVSRR